MKIAVTGHRPEKIEEPDFLQDKLESILNFLDPSAVIVGMASGVDLWAGEVALDLGIDVWAVKPWKGHRGRVTDNWLYDMVWEAAALQVVVNPAETYPGPWVYQDRNKWMVDHANQLVAIWDGSAGGTKHCVDYAIRKNLGILRYNPITKEITERKHNAT